MLTPIGVLGGIRGTFFFNLGGASLKGTPFQLFSRSTEQVTPTVGFRQNQETGGFEEVFGPPTNVSGFRLVDGRASYGLGLQTFVIGFSDPLRLVVADPLQQGVGGCRFREPGRKLGLPRAAIRLLDRL